MRAWIAGALFALLPCAWFWPAPAGAQERSGAAAELRIDTVGAIPVTRNLAREPFSLPDALRPRELFRIGSISGEEETLFGGPLIHVSNAPQGQLFVLDLMLLVIRAFGSDGTFLREFGRAGKGPGELSSPAALAWDADGHLWIPDPFERRYSVFDSLGTFVRTVPRPAFAGVNRRVYASMFGADGALLDHASFGGGAGIFRVDSVGVLLDSFPPMRYPPNPLAGSRTIERDPDVITASRNFRPRLIWTLAPDGTLWMARSDSLRVIHRTLEGDTLRVVEGMHRPSTFTRAEREVVDRASRMYEDVEFTPAVVQSLHASDDGLLFVQIAGELGEPGHEVDVFGPQGQYVGTFRLEIPIQPLSQSDVRDGYFSYAGVGELDVPIVVRLRVGG